jgi:polysaccharide export outer membrane protein
VLVRDAIVGRIATYETGIEVPGSQGAAAVQPMRKNSYSVTGEVHKPGEFDLAAPTTVLEALVRAGGFTGPDANRRIRILRNGGKDVRSFNFQEVLRGKNLEQNVAVEPGDIIVVTSNKF